MDQFTEKAKEALELSYEISEELGHNYIGSEHILCGLLREGSGLASVVLRSCGIDENTVLSLIERFVSAEYRVNNDMPGGYTPSARRIIEQSGREAARFRSKLIGTEHLLIAMLKDGDCLATRIINTTGVSIQRIYTSVLHAMGEDLQESQEDPKNAAKKSTTPTLDQYSRDLTRLAAEDRLDPVIGRREEIMRVIQILSRRTKNNPCLIGEPGVGKTAVVEGLARLIASGDAPETIDGKRLLSLDLSGMVAGSKYRGEFEERIKKVIQEAQADGGVLLFIDEIHTIIGAGGAEGALDAANILKPSLARGELQIIGATTVEEYRKHIEKDSALERRFQPVSVEEPSEQDTVEILKGLRPKYEEHHRVSISDGAIEAAVRMSSRYISDRFLPDKAIDLIDEAASRLRLRSAEPTDAVRRAEEKLEELNILREKCIAEGSAEELKSISARYKRAKNRLQRLNEQRESSKNRAGLTVTEDDIADIVSGWTKIPVQKLTEAETERIRNLESILHERIVSQDEAVTAISRAIKRGRVGIKDPKRPIGSFMFLGPTGVGKTELTKALAEAVFGSENALIRVDMSEYMEKHSVSKMIGSPPGYVGFDEGGQLSEKVRRNPYSVVLFDEIEKAHPDVFNILLQVLDDGRITDAQGRRVDFKNTIIIMTSNAGAENIVTPRRLGFTSGDDDKKNYADMKDKVLEEVKRLFRPEFLNRIDEIIVFHQLTKENMGRIVDIMFRDIAKRSLEQLELTVELADEARQILIDRGYDPKYGARPLRRILQTMVEDRLAEAVLDRTVLPGDAVLITADPEKEGGLRMTPVRRKRRKAPAKPGGTGKGAKLVSA